MKLFRGVYFHHYIHLIIWSLLLGIPTILAPNVVFFGLTKSYFILSTLFHIGIFYLNAYYLYPRFLTKKRWPLYILSIAIVIILVTKIKVFFLKLDPGFELTAENGRVVIFGLIPFIIASIIFRLISDRIRFERMEKEARAERLAAELKFLRSQVSPHFLFNMMTNMVSLARQKSDLLEPSLIQLADLLRYMLYDSNEGEIPVNKEIDHIENYVALQQLRFGEDVNVELRLKNNCEDCLIEPMLLVPFIENAFKHGIGLVKNPFINIHLEVNEHSLAFSVSNNFNSSNQSKDKNSGIGLANVKNRLALLYPGKYELSITDEREIFTIVLKLDLS